MIWWYIMLSQKVSPPWLHIVQPRPFSIKMTTWLTIMFKSKAFGWMVQKYVWYALVSFPDTWYSVTAHSISSVCIYCTYHSRIPLKHSSNPNDSFTYKNIQIQPWDIHRFNVILECHTTSKFLYVEVTKRQSVKVLKKWIFTPLHAEKSAAWWRGGNRTLHVPSSSRSWACGHRSEWARDSRTPSGRSPAGTARCTWGRFSNGSPRAPRTCSGRSWAGRWPRRADSVSCPCCEREEERTLALMSSQAMMWANRERGLIKSICLTRRGWPAALLIPTKGGAMQQNKHLTRYNAQVYKL